MHRRVRPLHGATRGRADGLGVRVPLLFSLAAAGCGSHGPSLGEVGVYDEGGAGFISPDGGAGGFVVRATASALSICAGQCVDLAAQASGGSAPYSYAWTGDATRDAGTVRACPTATTTYTVTATDSSARNGEIASTGATDSSSVTVAVGASCADAGGDATSTTEVCALSWAGSGQFFEGAYLAGAGWGGNRVATDASGNVYLTLGFAGDLAIGGKTYSSMGAIDSLVVKLDDQCRVTWVKQFGGPSSPPGGTQVWFNGLAVDSGGNVVLAGDAGSGSWLANATVDFGTGPLSLGFSDAVVMKLDPTGSITWLKDFPSNGSALLGMSPNNWIDDVAVQPDDGIVFVAGLAPGTNLGNGAIAAGSSSQTDGAYLVELKSDGSLIFAVKQDHFDTSVGLGPASGIWTSGCNYGAANDELGTSAAAPSGAPLWTTTSMVPAAFENSLCSSGVKVDGTGDALQLATSSTQASDADGGTTWTSSRVLAKIDPSGRALWRLDSPQLVLGGEPLSSSVSPFEDVYSGALSLDPAGNAYVSGTLEGTRDFSPVGTLASAGGMDVAVVVFDSAGTLRRVLRWGGADDDVPFATAIDRRGDLVVVGLSVPPSSASSGPPPGSPEAGSAPNGYRVFVTKLR